MNKKSILFLVIACLAGFACKDNPVNDTFERPVLTTIYATFEDGSGFFIPETPSPYGDTIKIVVDIRIPIETGEPTDVSNMRLKAVEPVKISGVYDLVDLNQKPSITITAADGTQTSHIVTVKFRKFSEAGITSFKLLEPELEGWIIEERNMIGLIAGGADLNNRAAELTVSTYAAISPDPATPQNFNHPVVYTVTAEDGTKVEWTVMSISPQKLPSGMRKGSAKRLWYKSINELGLYQNGGAAGDPLAHLSIALAVSGDYLMVNTRSIANKYYDRYTGEYAGTLPMQGEHTGNLRNFFSASDEAGNILICNLVPNDETDPAESLLIYKWRGLTDNNPVKYIEWKHDIPDLSASVRPTVGRKMSIKGNLDGDALIFMGTGNTNCTILRWQVIGGVLQSQTPVKFTYPFMPPQIQWAQYGDVISAGTRLTDNLFIIGYGNMADPNNSTLVCFNPVRNIVVGSVPLSESGYIAPVSLDLVTFNRTPYLATVSIGPASPVANTDSYGSAWLYNVTNPALLSTLPNDAGYADVCVFKTETLHSAFALGNGNRTGDVVMKVSDDGYKMILYLLATNAGIVAYEFVCIDIDRIGE